MRTGSANSRTAAREPAVRYSLDVRSRIFFVAAVLLGFAAAAEAQTYARPQPRRHFVTVSYDSLYTQPLHFAEHPLSDLAGSEVASAQGEAYDYRTRDGAVAIDVVEFSRRSRGAAVAVYPFGMSSGPALMLRGSYERMPRIRVAFDGPAPFPSYEFLDASAIDGALGVVVADRSPGWGLGSHAFLAGGLGRIASSLGDGHRYFAEAGGGLGAGPIGVELAVKFAWNHLSEPVTHSFLTIPVTVRGTLTF